MKKLFIGKDGFTLPLELVTQTVAILAKRGKGKTTLANVFAEELLENGQQVVIIDPTGASWGLRSTKDGKKEGFPIVVFGGTSPAKTLPLEEHAGEILAKSIVRERFSAILDTSDFNKAQYRRFLTSFFETFYRINTTPVHVIIDEADVIAPQKPFGDQAILLGAVEDLLKRGRKKGIGCTLITQRPQDLAKQVLTQCEMLVAMGMSHPRDIGAIEEWVAVHGDETLAKEMIESLPSLPVGTAWFWAPGWGDVFEKVEVRQRATFDSSATPKPGEKVTKPKKLSPIDVEKLGAEIQATVSEVKENDPRELKARIKKLEAEAKRKSDVTLLSAKSIAEANFEKGFNTGIEKERKSWSAWWRKMRELFMSAPIEKLTDTRFQNAAKELKERVVHLDLPGSNLKFIEEVKRDDHTQTFTPRGGMKRMLMALADRPKGLTKAQIAIRAGLAQSGTFSTYLSNLRAADYIKTDGNIFGITAEGFKALGDYNPLPSGSDLQVYWLSKLTGGKKRILEALLDIHPERISKRDLAERVGQTESGTFSTYLSNLRALELIKGSNVLEVNEELFE